MTNEELTVELLDKLGWDYDKVLNPGHYKNTEDLYAGDLILAILSTNSTPEAADMLGIAYKTIITLSPRFLQPIFGRLNGGNETWKFKFLHYLEYKICSSCHTLLPYTEYHLDRSSSRGVSSSCRKCKIVENAIMYRKDSVKESHKRSYEKHKPAILERNIRSKGERALRVPTWSQTQDIIKIYESCPEGYHVDHELPLKGELVSGLHVKENLQYLTAEENIKKGNRIDLDAYNKKHFKS